MSSSEARRPSRRAAAGALLAAAALAASGCGFRPLHRDAVPEALASVEVAPVPGRGGEMLRDALVRALHPRGRSGAPAYRLEASFRSSSSALVTDRTTFIRRYEVGAQARYRLVEIATGRELGSAERSARASHGVIPNEIYSTLVAAETALRRASTLLADAIATEVALVLEADLDR